jgi:hypothetical protein
MRSVSWRTSEVAQTTQSMRLPLPSQVGTPPAGAAAPPLRSHDPWAAVSPAARGTPGR